MTRDRKISNLAFDAVTQPGPIRLHPRETQIRAKDLAEPVGTVLAVEGGVGDRHTKPDGAANGVGNGATHTVGPVVSSNLTSQGPPTFRGSPPTPREVGHSHMLWSGGCALRTVNQEEPVYPPPIGTFRR